MEIAKHDISYCVNEKCKECCWRNITHWCFEDEIKFKFNLRR